MKAVAEIPPTKPAYLSVKPENIPANLKDMKAWVCWKAALNDTGTKWTKPPYQPSGMAAKVNDPSTWSDFDACLKAYQAGNKGFDGIGIMMNTDITGITGFDFDHCMNGSIISKEVKGFIETMGTYTEVSPSNNGIRILCFGQKPPDANSKNPAKGYEIYDSGRYLTITGQTLNSLPVIENCNDRIAAVCRAAFPSVSISQEAVSATINTERGLLDLSDNDLLDKARAAKNGSKFISLYDHGENGDDHSAADMALCGILAYWTGRDAGRLDRLFRASALMRPKWDEKRYADGRTYGQGTIQRAIAGCDTVYTGSQEATIYETHRTATNISTASPEPAQTAPVSEEESRAIPDAFWYEGRNSRGDIVLKIDSAKLYRLLKKNGFRRIEYAKKVWLVRITNNICEHIENSDIMSFVNKYINSLPYKISPQKNRLELENFFAKGINSYLSDSQNAYFFSDIETPVFLTDPKDKSYFFFRNGFVEVSENSRVLKPYRKLPGTIWQSQVINRDYEYIQDFSDFSFTRFLKLICTQKETGTFEEMRHKALKQTLGYLLHNFRRAHNSRAVIFTEASLDEDPTGRTGKGLILQALGQLRKKVTVDGKNFKFDNQFAFQSVELDTQILFLDDVKKNFDFERLYSAIGEGLSFEKKNQDRVNLPVEQSPKIVISTNYAVKGSSESDKGRRIDIELLCYFNSKHRPEHEFGGMFFDDAWTGRDWNMLYNLLFDCVHEWLKAGRQVTEYESSTASLKQIYTETSPEFVEFCDDLPDGKHDTSVIWQNYIRLNSLQEKAFTKSKFSRWMKKWATNREIEIDYKKERIPSNASPVSMVTIKRGATKGIKPVPNLSAESSCPSCEYFDSIYQYCRKHDGGYLRAFEKCKNSDFKNVNR